MQESDLFYMLLFLQFPILSYKYIQHYILKQINIVKE